jgi:sporulation protein YlmC with PRC-barrel domain
MLVSEAMSHKVMSTESASTVAKVAGFIVDPTGPRVLALRLAKTRGNGDTLHWEDLQGFGPDAVTVADEGAITAARGRAADLSGKQFELLGKRVLDDRGDEVGQVQDLEFDPETGTVTTVLTSHGPVPGERLVACGSYAVIVTAEHP